MVSPELKFNWQSEINSWYLRSLGLKFYKVLSWTGRYVDRGIQWYMTQTDKWNKTNIIGLWTGHFMAAKNNFSRHNFIGLLEKKLKKLFGEDRILQNGMKLKVKINYKKIYYLLFSPTFTFLRGTKYICISKFQHSKCVTMTNNCNAKKFVISYSFLRNDVSKYKYQGCIIEYDVMYTYNILFLQKIHYK